MGGNGKAAAPGASHMNIAVISTFVDSYSFFRCGESRGSSKVTPPECLYRQPGEQDMDNLIDKDIIDGLIVEPAKSALPIQICITTRSLRNGESRFCSSTAGIRTGAALRVHERRAGGQEAVEYLIKNGHRNIGGVFKSDDGQGAFEV